MIESKNCSFRYQNSTNDVLKNLDLHIQPGECVILCGKSGCGKTTLTRLLNGLVPSFFPGELTGSCTTFDLEAGDSDIEDYVPLVGNVFQNPKTQYFNVDTTAELAFPCENTGMCAHAIQERVHNCAKEFHLDKLLNRSIFKLSGGEKQRIAFGAACMLSPKLLVLDEPTSNLDYHAINELHDMIAHQKEMGTTIVIAEHRLAWIADLADRFCYFEDGKLIKQWSGDTFKALPACKLQTMGLRPLDIQPYHLQALEKSKCVPSCSNPLISVQDLFIGYGKKSPVYQIDSFQICKGEIVGLMGHNGVGKSTFARTLCGLLKPICGSIRPAKEKERLSHSFMVMQDVNYQLFSDSVREEVLLGAGKPELCEQVLEALGLLALADRHPMSLSGGQKQRVAIASAMLSGKDFIVLDEPTSGLDYYHMTQVAQLLNQLKEQGAAVLVITHDEELAAGWCDRVIYLHDKEKENEFQ
ncbi:MAG: energy-coupling factor ABC transporter ATP-binding protein [Lachnospiraceae bacterium]|nr:energy-coupling factor ABC transporter ATP-binding protein [Lachnospiraceae bacterium]